MRIILTRVSIKSGTRIAPVQEFIGLCPKSPWSSFVVFSDANPVASLALRLSITVQII
jgi:hypothetical protein